MCTDSRSIAIIGCAEIHSQESVQAYLRNTKSVCVYAITVANKYSTPHAARLYRYRIRAADDQLLRDSLRQVDTAV